MTHTDWLVTLNDEQPSMTEGLPWRFWWTTQRDRATGEVRRRADGKPYTPMWLPGDDVFVRYAGSDRVIAWLILDGEPEWIAEEEWFETDSTVHVLDPDGPTLADIGIARAVQGGRQRLNADQRTAAVAALADSAAYRFGQAVEAAARRAVAHGVAAGWSAA